jgi:hypothetical protein
MTHMGTQAERRKGSEHGEGWLISPQRYSAARFRPSEASAWAEWVEVTEAELRPPGKQLAGQPRRMLRVNAERLWLNLVELGLEAM